MFDKNFQLLIQEVSAVAGERLGPEFVEYMADLMKERERLLNNVWSKQTEIDLDESDTDQVLREIDFDTVTLHAARYMERNEYAIFIFDIAELALRFGQMEKVQGLLQLLIHKYSADAGQELLARTYHLLGRVSFYVSEYQIATKHYENSLAIYTELGDQHGISTMQSAMGIVLVSSGQVSKGVDLFNRALVTAEDNDYSDLIIKININLGNSFIIRGKWRLAQQSFDNALSALGNEQNDDLRARIFHNLSIIHSSQKDPEKALKYLEKSLDYSEKTHNVYLKSLSYLEESGIKCAQGDFNSATALATTAFHTFAEMGDRISMADVYKTLGVINRDRSNYEAAISFFENSQKINHDYNNYLNLGETLLEMAILYKGLNDAGRAKNLVNDAIDCFHRIEADTRVSLAAEILG